MSDQLVPLEVNAIPELRQLAEQVDESGVGRVLVRDGKPIAILTPVRGEDTAAEIKPRQRRRLQPERILDIIGTGSTAEPTDILNHKREYVADAAEHRE